MPGQADHADQDIGGGAARAYFGGVYVDAGVYARRFGHAGGDKRVDGIENERDDK